MDINNVLKEVYGKQILKQLEESKRVLEYMRREVVISQALTDCILGRANYPELQGEFPDDFNETLVTFRIRKDR